MEIKKSSKASLEPQRPVWFLLGLVVALSTLYVALEFSASTTDSSDDSALFDDMHDLDLLPALDRSDMIAATPEPARPKPSVKQLKVVDKVRDEMSKLNTITDLRTTQGDADGADGSSTADDAPTTTAQPPVAVDADDNPLRLRVVEQLPEFPGGMVELMKWITKNLKYPYLAQKQKIEGQVKVTFIINRDGSIGDIKVVKSVHPLLDNEALRVVKAMPQWKPGIENGKPCRTMFAIPVEFRL